ncbi:cytochrome c [Massilia sp. B-10]|nr:cytochrome c [Massilia sp. B-10]
MNKRQARLFAIGSSLLAAVALVGLTFDSHRQFDKLTNADKISAEVSRGKDVWHNNNCINCHTVFGEGAYYAPDLTKITKLRGNAYLTAYMRDPSKFYDETRHRRLMPKQNLSRARHFRPDRLPRLGQQCRQPGLAAAPAAGDRFHLPRHRSGRSPACARCAGRQHRRARARWPAGEDPIALGERVPGSDPGLHGLSFDCAWCQHGRAFAGLAWCSVPGPCWPILATRARRPMLLSYIRESVQNPSAHLVPGAMYSTNGVSFMPDNYAKSLTPQQIDQLAAYLTSLK